MILQFIRVCKDESSRVSLICINNKNECQLINHIKENRFNIKNPNNIFIFEFLSDQKIRCELTKNCIVPYDNQHYLCGTTDSFYDEKGQNLNTFENGFMKKCIFGTPVFIMSSPFSISNAFSNSHVFLSTSQFTQSSHFTKSDSFSPTYIPTKTLHEQTIIKSYLLTDVTVKTVIYSYSKSQTNTFLLTYNEDLQTYFITVTESYFNQYLPYIIYSLSPSYIPTMFVVELAKKKSLSPENLIGISCGSVAEFFFILFVIISVIRVKQNRFIFSDITESVSDDSYSDSETAIEQNLETRFTNTDDNDKLDL